MHVHESQISAPSWRLIKWQASLHMHIFFLLANFSLLSMIISSVGLICVLNHTNIRFTAIVVASEGLEIVRG